VEGGLRGGTRKGEKGVEQGSGKRRGNVDLDPKIKPKSLLQNA